MTRLHVGEYLDLDVESEHWHCRSCDMDWGSARENYKTGLLVYERDPTEIHRRLVPGDISFAPDPAWIRIIEFYCPSCGTQVETEYLPQGHPLTHEIELDIDSLKRRLEAGEVRIADGRIEATK